MDNAKAIWLNASSLKNICYSELYTNKFKDVDKFLEKSFLKWSQSQIKNMNSPLTIKEIKSVVKNLSKLQQIFLVSSTSIQEPNNSSVT